MTKQDYLFKTIEFTKVDEVTPYAVTTITPVFSGDIYAKYPNENFTYSSLDEMKIHLKELFDYTDAQINEYITTLQIHTTRTYYKPLYTIKWYIGGLYDYMHTSRYISSEDKDSLVHPEIDDSKINDGQNEVLGYVFPERLMKLIRNKPINRMRMYVNAAPTNTYYKSDLNFFDNFQWVNTSQFNPTADGTTVGIKIAGTTLNTYMWVVYGGTTNDTQLTSAFDPTLHRYIGISCNNISDIAKTLPSDNADPNNRWPEYSWQQISLQDPATSLDDPDTPSYIYLGTYTYQLYIRYTDNKNNGSISPYSVDKFGKQYKYIGFQLILQNDGITHDINDINKYDWHILSSLRNIIMYDINNTKRYYLYIRFIDNRNNVYDNISESNYISYIKLSFFNSTNVKTNNYSYNNISSYEATIPFNVFADYQYLYGSTYKYVWVKFADTLTPSTAEELYNYGIYNNGDSNKIRNYIVLLLDQTSADVTTIDTTDTKCYKIKIQDLTTEYSYTATSYNSANQECDRWIHIKFANRIPRNINEAYNYYSVNSTVYIGISITDKNGQYHTVQSNQGTELEEYIWIPIKNLEIPTSFSKDRYVYFTYANDLNDPDKRSQCPVYTNDVNTVVNKKLFGYAYDLDVSISNKHKLVNEVDKTSREITLYRADSLNALTEAHIHKITTINIPYTTMGKYSVFNFDPVVINDNEYLIIGGNRDNTCPLVCVNNLDFINGQHPDYALENLHLDTKYNELRPQVTGSEVMYYTNANFLTLDNWTPETRKYLPIDIGCGFASASNEVQVTTKSFKEILAETQTNDEVALQQYKDEHSDKYTAPNYNLYVNLTYKFAKIIDGNIDYMPLYNRYKIKYKFKNENQQILQQKVFDTSVITPDGSVYDKPTQIIIDDVTYTKTSQKYLDYFDYIEGDFTQTIKETDKEVTDRDYDVAYFQCNNILEDLYQSNNSQQFNADYYNYKFLADDSHKEYLPVLCEVTISAYETNTALYTRAIPVTLAAYSLVEITDDYIRTTVSKIENDYIYGLTQRTSRIEQYADRISMSVQNITQGLYSRMQMTEDKILMEVVDASKNIGAAFNMTANKIQSLVYDTSAHMYSQILVEKNKISLEVANDFRKAGIYLTDDSAEIDAPKITLHGDRTTIKGALSIQQQTNEIDGFIMYNINGDDKIHITVENIPKFEDLGGSAKSQTLYFSQNRDITIPIDKNAENVIDPKSLYFPNLTAQFYAYSKLCILSGIKVSGILTDPFTFETYDINDIFDLRSFIVAWRLWFCTKEIDVYSSSRNLLEDDEMLYGEGETTPTIIWSLDGSAIDTTKSIKQYIGAIDGNIPYLQLSSNINNSNVEISSSDKQGEIISSLRTQYVMTTNRINLLPTFVESNITYTPVTITITASMTATIDGTTYTDTQIFLLELARASQFYWEYDSNRINVTTGICYTDASDKSSLPHIGFAGNDITISDISFTVSPTSHGIDVNSNGVIFINSTNIDNTTVIVTATYNGTISIYNGISKQCTITKNTYYNGITIPPVTEVDPDFNENNKQLLTLDYDWNKKDKDGYYFYFYSLSDRYYLSRPLSSPQDIKLILENDNTRNRMLIDQYSITAGHFYGEFYWDALLYYMAKQSAGHDGYLCLTVNPQYWNVLISGVFPEKITVEEPPIKAGCISTGRLMFMPQTAPSGSGKYNIVELCISIDTFNNLNALMFYKNYVTASYDYDDATFNRGKYIYKRKQVADPIIYNNSTLKYEFKNDFEFDTTLKIPNVIIKINENTDVVISFYIEETDYYKLTSNFNTNEGVFDAHLCGTGNTYDTCSPLYIKDIKFYSMHPLIWRLKNIDSNINTLSITNLSIYTEISYNITAGTRIGENGMYSYIDQKSLFYFNEDVIAMRNHGNGIRLLNTNVAGEPYMQSRGLEVFVGDNSWSNADWFSLFNFTPLLRFYLASGGIWKYPKQQLIWNSTTNKWEENTKRTSEYPVYLNDHVANNKAELLALRAGWDYGRIYSLGTPEAEAKYFYWKYDASYHKGMLSMEQFCGQPWASDSKVRHFILLPMKYYNDNHDYARNIPAGYTVTIMNSQFFMSEKTFNKDTKREHNCILGWRKQPLYVGVYDYDDDSDGFTNDNFLFYDTNGTRAGQYYNNSFTMNNTPANFIDGHGDLCAAIQLTYDDGSYLEGDYVQCSTATFIWTGYVWHSSVDVDTHYQCYGSGDG